MTYAGNRRIVDADSHLMEWPGFLTDNADPALRARMPAIVGNASRLVPRASGQDAETKAALLALGDDLRRGPKWHDALGAVDPQDRIVALDLLGFERQVIYSSLCASLFDLPEPALRYGAYRAHNRAMAGYCAADARLHGVALCDLDDSDAALAEISFALDAGLRLLWIPARAPGGRAPGHAALDRIWATLAERHVPFVLHVGSGPLPIGAGWNDNGRPQPEGMAGAEITSARDFQVVHHTHARFLAALVLDGVLERHPGLRGGAIEVGAGWVPVSCADSITPWTSGNAPSPICVHSRASPPNKPSSNCASRTTRSRTWAHSFANQILGSTCSRRTTRTPRVAATR